LEAFLAALGCTPADSLEDFLYIPLGELNTAMDTFKVGESTANSMQRGQATRFVAAAHALKSGPTSLEEIVVSAGAAPKAAPQGQDNPPPAANNRKFAEVLDQADDTTYEELSAEKVATLRAAHVTITGGAPSDDNRPTSEQLSALGARIAAGRAPFVDFAVWGPFGRRAAKLLKYSAQVFVEGQLQTRMMKGPASFESWRSSWKVFRAAMLMHHAAKPSALDGYEEGIRQLAVLFPGGWGTIACADETLRAEQWDVMLEQLRATKPAGFDEEMPWDFILTCSSYGVAGAMKAHFWETRVVLPLLQGARGAATNTAAKLEGATQPPPQPDDSWEAPSRRNRAGRRGQGKQNQKTGAQQPAHQQTQPQPQSQPQYCWAWNRQGSCPDPCPAGRVHRCEICDKPGHKGKDCWSKSGGKGKSGKGKGKGSKL